MRILHVVRSLDPASGGPIESLRQMTELLQAQGHRADVVTLDALDVHWALDFPADVIAVGPARFNYGYAPRLVPWLRANARAYDAVVVRGIWQYHSFGAWRALRDSDVPYFVFTHGMLDPWFKRRYPLKHLKKMLYWPWAEYRVLRDARAVLFTSEQERILARQSFGRYRCNERVINYGTAAPTGDPQDYREALFTAHPELRGRRFLLFLGRIHEKKGCDLLLQAFAALAGGEPGLDLVMAGPDQVGWRPRLEKLAAELGIAERVIWTGMLTGDAKWGAYHAAEAFVLPSHQENFGIVVAEALACGLPVLISDQVNIWREVEAAGAGIVDSDDVEGATGMLRRWLALPVAERESMRVKARECFNKRFEIGRAVESLEQVLRTGGGGHDDSA